MDGKRYADGAAGYAADGADSIGQTKFVIHGFVMEPAVSGITIVNKTIQAGIDLTRPVIRQCQTSVVANVDTHQTIVAPIRAPLHGMTGKTDRTRIRLHTEMRC